MKSYAETLIAPWEMELFQKAEKLVTAVLDREDPSEIRCHEVARAAGRILDLPVQDGHFGLTEHSWLWTKKPRGFMPKLIDVYAVGSLPIVQIVDMTHCLAHRQSYRIGKERDDIRWDVVEQLVLEMSKPDRFQVLSYHEDTPKRLQG